MVNCVPGEREPYEPFDPLEHTWNITYPTNWITVFSAWELGLKIGFYSAAIALAVIGNILVILTVALKPRMRTSTNLYLVNLAASDLMVGALNMWMHLLVNIRDVFPFGRAICKGFYFLQIFWLTASVLFMTVIACERFVAIVYPLTARLTRPAQHAAVMLAVWVVAALVALPNLLVRQRLELIFANDFHLVWCTEEWPRYPRKVQDPTKLGCQYDFPQRQIYFTLQVVVMYLVPVLVMSVVYALIVRRLRQRQRASGSMHGSGTASQQRQTARVVRMLVGVLLVFVLCWTPQEVFVFIDANWPDTTAETSSNVRFALIYIAYVNSALNPLLYAGLNTNFRAAFRELTHCQGGNAQHRGAKVSPAGAVEMAEQTARPKDETRSTPDTARTCHKQISDEGSPAPPSPASSSVRDTTPEEPGNELNDAQAA